MINFGHFVLLSLTSQDLQVKI